MRPDSPRDFGAIIYLLTYLLTWDGGLLQIINGTQDDAGVYTCVGERAMDRTYVSSWVHLARPLPPVMLFLPCSDLTPTSGAAGTSTSQPYQVWHVQSPSNDDHWRLVVKFSGRTSVSNRRTFHSLHLTYTCSWSVAINMGKPSAVCQLTRPTQPFILLVR